MREICSYHQELGTAMSDKASTPEGIPAREQEAQNQKLIVLAIDLLICTAAATPMSKLK